MTAAWPLPRPEGDAAIPAAPQQDVPRHDALSLTAGRGEARIVLRDMVYTLRITRQGKLILTK